MKYKDFSGYLVPSERVLSVEHLLEVIKKYGEVVVKPSEGCQGDDVYFVSGAEIPAIILDKISKEEFIVQPYINCRTKDGKAFDFRLHVQKNSMGKWVSAKIYPRTAQGDSIVCNISSGGCTGDLNAFLVREFGKEHFNVRKSMESFSLQLAAHMDKIQRELYDEELDELGIDIGIDKGGKIWIYEVNWRPGYPPSMNLDLNVVKNTVQYAMFLAKK
jgi:UDP-N-acetylmuramoyl-tripeptide--D-alanyl-D-alanine ligase